MRPLRVVVDGLDRLRSDDAEDVHAERRLRASARAAPGSAAAVAELHATTSSFA